MLIMHDPMIGQSFWCPSAVQAVAIFGAAAVLMALPSPACHFRRCRTAPLAPVSTNATLLPSPDSTGEVCTVPIVIPVAPKFVLYDQSTAGSVTPQSGRPLPAYSLL